MKKICSLFLIGILLLTGCSVKKTEKLTDADKFAREYSVAKTNPFKYVNSDEVINILENGTGVIFFGDPDCDWCRASANILTTALKYKNIEKAYYYNPKKIRDNNTKTYQKLLKLLGDNIEEDENGNKYLFMPDIYVVVNGKIIDHNNDLASMEGSIDEVLTKERKKQIKKIYNELLSNYTLKKESTNS